ncbi:MAG: hypothetical protein B6226_00710 [Candidatus Cloacimonetes bacterium 4572_65]|nr:MAG: hypothetical protein B6226_00710 [Candidatus Cloacimonetes bacterium 4572_65]
MKENIKVLKHKKQIILQGAPGTGKTYISAEIAMNLIHNDKKYNSRKQIMVDYQKAIEDGRIAFTTFHQSMDYEEFVEGLKPELTETGGVTYAVQPGIFKEMCNKAQEKGSLDKLEEAIENLKEKALEETINLETKTELAFTLSYRGGTTFRVRPQSSKTDENNDFPANISYIKELFKNEKAKMYNKSYVWGILDYLKKNFDLGTYTESSEALPYILIIDEINRGNISKVLGELITLLESDKRIGEENEIRVKLPYSSEDEPFGVPSNLYIIGTMNTADRSVGHIDYAIRRRFSFITLQSQLSAIENYYTKLGDNNAPNEIAIELFEEIEELMENIAPDFDKHDLMIGHSYFMAKTEEDLELKLKYEIKPLLREYVKDGILLLQPDENGDYQEIEGIEL